MARSTVLLGMIGADYPNYLSQTFVYCTLTVYGYWNNLKTDTYFLMVFFSVASNIALSLVLLLHDSSKLSHRLAALELCGRGFSTWEPHIL